MGVIVAVDGPAGSGKSSVSRAAAAALGFAFLDTGAAYRALAWSVLEQGADPEDPAAVEAALDGFAYDLAEDPAEQWVRVGGTDVTDEIRTPRVTAAVSGIARVPAVRVRLNEGFRARLAAAEPGVVAEGRDITTVVAPHADVLAAGNDGVARIPGKHGVDLRTTTLTVLVDDRPGQIARLLTEIGELGVNLEDMRLEHSPGAPIGIVELAVAPEVAGGLEADLVRRGWRVA